jgi:DNA repair protein RadC
MTIHPPNETHDFPPAIGQPATGALLAAGYSRLEQLTQMTEADLIKLHGMGPKALSILRQTLEANGLSFATNDFAKLAQPAQRALAGAGYARLEQLTHVRESELKQLHGIGPNVLKQLRASLEAKGWAFAPEH